MDAFEKAVGESFTKLAFEAVDKIINVSEGNPECVNFKFFDFNLQ